MSRRNSRQKKTVALEATVKGFTPENKELFGKALRDGRLTEDMIRAGFEKDLSGSSERLGGPFYKDHKELQKAKDQIYELAKNKLLDAAGVDAKGTPLTEIVLGDNDDVENVKSLSHHGTDSRVMDALGKENLGSMDKIITDFVKLHADDEGDLSDERRKELSGILTEEAVSRLKEKGMMMPEGKTLSIEANQALAIAPEQVPTAETALMSVAKKKLKHEACGILEKAGFTVSTLVPKLEEVYYKFKNGPTLRGFDEPMYAAVYEFINDLKTNSYSHKECLGHFAEYMAHVSGEAYPVDSDSPETIKQKEEFRQKALTNGQEFVEYMAMLWASTQADEDAIPRAMERMLAEDDALQQVDQRVSGRHIFKEPLPDDVLNQYSDKLTSSEEDVQKYRESAGFRGTWDEIKKNYEYHFDMAMHSMKHQVDFQSGRTDTSLLDIIRLWEISLGLDGNVGVIGSGDFGNATFCSAASLWSHAKNGQQTFRIGPNLYRMLSDTSLEGVQLSDIKLPYDCIYIHFPEECRESLWGGSRTGMHDLQGIYLRKTLYYEADAQGKKHPDNIMTMSVGLPNDNSKDWGDDSLVFSPLSHTEYDRAGHLDLEAYLSAKSDPENRRIHRENDVGFQKYLNTVSEEERELIGSDKNGVTHFKMVRVALNALLYLNMGTPAEVISEPSSMDRRNLRDLKSKLDRKNARLAKQGREHVNDKRIEKKIIHLMRPTVRHIGSLFERTSPTYTAHDIPVRGHYRRYLKSGKITWIKPHIRRKTDDGVVMANIAREYSLEKEREREKEAG